MAVAVSTGLVAGTGRSNSLPILQLSATWSTLSVNGSKVLIPASVEAVQDSSQSWQAATQSSSYAQPVFLQVTNQPLWVATKKDRDLQTEKKVITAGQWLLYCVNSRPR